MQIRTASCFKCELAMQGELTPEREAELTVAHVSGFGDMPKISITNKSDNMTEEEKTEKESRGAFVRKVVKQANKFATQIVTRKKQKPKELESVTVAKEKKPKRLFEHGVILTKKPTE